MIGEPEAALGVPSASLAAGVAAVVLVVELASAGHYPADETPLELVRTVEDFIAAGG